ncbi:hypothetical protein [Lichenihabitans psoromatis]|uniref:hypothetical protein n=1 Tax=Lichenihabitans psoromatis TaxID=2528642 RepID=UPI0010361334|nr:hypothetical protein [Lichenihabitans psoromatis]
MPITYHVVVPFDRSDEGDLVAGEALEAPNSDIARRRAQALVPTHVGALAFSRTGDPDSGEFADAVVTAEFGEVDKGSLFG